MLARLAPASMAIRMPVTLVVGRAQRHDRVADEAGHHVLVPLEAAAGKDDSLASPDQLVTTACSAHPDAHDGAVDHDELLYRAVGLHRHRTVEQSFEK